MDPDQQALSELSSSVSLLFKNSIYGPALEILALIALSSNEGLGEPGQIAARHTSMEVDEKSEENLDLWTHWIHQHGPLKVAFTHI